VRRDEVTTGESDWIMTAKHLPTLRFVGASLRSTSVVASVYSSRSFDRRTEDTELPILIVLAALEDKGLIDCALVVGHVCSSQLTLRQA
jgi:hypothetical protein